MKKNYPLYFAGLLAAFIMTFLAIASYSTLTHIIRSIAILKQATAQVASGNFGVQVPVLGNDELGELTTAFNKMNTALKNSEDVRRESEQRFADVVAVSGDFIWETDEFGVFTFVSDQVEVPLGYSAEELLGSSFVKLSQGKNPERVPTWLKNLSLAASVQRELDLNAQNKNGEWIWLSLCGTAIYKDGVLRGYRGSGNDISEQQHQLVTTSKMAALGEMAGTIAHEINTPLATIQNTAGQMQDLLGDKTVDRAMLHEMTKTVESTCDRISKIVKGLRIISRDGSVESFEAIELRQLVRDTVVFCGERMSRQGIILDVNNIPEHLKCECRSTQVSQIILNLLNNAADAIVNLEKKWITVSAEDTGDRVKIFVKDCGAGLPANVLDKLFQPFFTTKAIGKGTGIGLSISRKLAEEHDGSLSVDVSSPNTCFVLELPKRHSV